MNYQVYVRGHGGEEAHVLPPVQHSDIDLVTVGEMGSTMSDEVADTIIFDHWNTQKIQTNIDNENLIYWTREERDEYYNTGKLHYTKPVMSITPEQSLHWNLVVEGAADIEGTCGLGYWNAPKGEITWIKKLNPGETLYLAEILNILASMLQPGDSAQLYWSACLSAQYWSGNRKKVSFNPTSK